MAKDLKNPKLQMKHPYFAEKLIAQLRVLHIQITPTKFAAAFNNHYKTTVAKPHTVRKWLLGQTQPKSETLLLLANWLGNRPLEPKALEVEFFPMEEVLHEKVKIH